MSANTTTRARLRRLVTRYPTWTAARLAARLGVTKHRVYQLLHDEGYRPEWRKMGAR